MTPANQRLGAYDVTGLQVYEGLVVEFKLVLFYGLTHRVAKQHAVARSMVEVFVVEAVGARTRLSRRRQGDRSALQHFPGRRVGREMAEIAALKHGSANTRFDCYCIIADQDRLADIPDEGVDVLAGLCSNRLAVTKNGEFSVATTRGTTERLTPLRKTIATRMVESLHVAAQLTTVVEADVTKIARLRQQAKAGFEAREGVKLSFLPFFALAAIEALKVHPVVNASLDLTAGTVTYPAAEHLGVAVDTPRGLLVPVIKDAGDLNLGGIARKIADLAERTRTNKVTPDELGGGTFTLTNTGSRGALFDTPIINQPNSAILGTGTVVKRAVVVDDPSLGEVIAVRSIVYLALSYDHRIVDGADAARYLNTMKARLEEGAFEADLGL